MNKQINNGIPRGLLPQLQKAIKQAQQSDYLFRLGSVVLNNGKPIGKGFNKNKTHAGLHKKYNFFSLHAEVASCLSAKCGNVLIVVRINKQNNLTCSKPCSRCFQFMKDFGIKKVYYSTWEGTIKQMRVV